MAVNSDASHQGFMNILQKNLDELRNLVACRICIRPMYEPYTTQCGHTFCYSCLRQWFDRDQIKKTCPDCRAHVQSQPAPAFLVREITQTFVNTAALLPAGETTEDHRKSQREEADLVEKDKAGQAGGGGLFNGRFNGLARYRAPIRDSLDGVDRCPRCTWELEDGTCNSCGYSFLDNFSNSDETTMTIDDLSMDSDHSDISLAAEALLAEDAEFRIDRAGNVRRHNQIHRRRGLPFGNLHRRFRGLSESSNGITDGDLTDLTVDSQSTGSTGSLRDFVADETMGIDDAGANSDHTSDMPPSTYDSGSEHSADHDEPSSPPFDLGSNMNPSTTARRRFRGRRVAMSSPEPNDSDSDTSHSTQQTGQHHEDFSMPGGFSPLQSSPVSGRSQDVPISIDSDSDAPPIRPVGRRRKRPTTLSISSDEETSGTRGVDIPLSPSSRASDITARNGAPLSMASNSPLSSIVINSSPLRLTSPSQSPSPRLNARDRLNARHRLLASVPPTEDPSVERLGPHGPPSISSRNTSAGPSNSRETIRASLAHMRERSERRGRQSGSPSNVQHRQERKRLKRQLRARQRQERPSREEWNRPIPHQQLAYIGG
ncbi:MAG: hypothetical protein L6R42_007558 [Xanthoria sp. 1 TBL-2021]|nr:MAG: hypothetical protein L6R42_007558 [Xanthoria sp. 1 TBL-2021]